MFTSLVADGRTHGRTDRLTTLCLRLPVCPGGGIKADYRPREVNQWLSVARQQHDMRPYVLALTAQAPTAVVWIASCVQIAPWYVHRDSHTDGNIIARLSRQVPVFATVLYWTKVVAWTGGRHDPQSLQSEKIRMAEKHLDDIRISRIIA